MSKYAPHKRSLNQPRASSSTTCQKCLQKGHFTYECKYERPYVSRPSRTQQLENPRILAKLKADGKPSVEVPEEFKDKTGIANKILEAKEKERSKDIKATEITSSRKRARSASISSHSDSESGSSLSSDSESDSESESSTSSSPESDSDSSASQSSGSRSRNHKRRRRRSPSNESDRPGHKR